MVQNLKLSLIFFRLENFSVRVGGRVGGRVTDGDKKCPLIFLYSSMLTRKIYSVLIYEKKAITNFVMSLKIWDKVGSSGFRE